MLPSNVMQTLIDKREAQDTELVLTRQSGVLSRAVIEDDLLLNEKILTADYTLDKESGTVRLVAGEKLILIGNRVGFSGTARVRVFFLDSEYMAVELLSGAMFTTNKNGVQFGFDMNKLIVKNSTAMPVKWVTVADMQEIISLRLNTLFNVPKNVNADYMYNGTFEYEFDYSDGSGKTPTSKPSTAVLDFRARPAYEEGNPTAFLIPNLAMGEFDFPVREKPKKYQSRDAEYLLNLPATPPQPKEEKPKVEAKPAEPKPAKPKNSTKGKLKKPKKTDTILDYFNMGDDEEEIDESEVYDEDEELVEEEDYDEGYEEGFDPTVDNSSDEDLGMFDDGVYNE